MSSELPTPSPEQPPKPRRARVSQEKIMVLLTLVFFAGVLAYTFLPEGPVRVAGITLVSLGVVWVLYKST